MDGILTCEIINSRFKKSISLFLSGTHYDIVIKESCLTVKNFCRSILDDILKISFSKIDLHENKGNFFPN